MGLGEARDSAGNVTARAWCEAVVQRVPEYLDEVDAPETAYAGLTSEANKTYGRKMRLVSFRWLSSDEI